MCTLTVRFDPDSETPVTVAANRDERYGRSSEPPSVIIEKPAVFAPRDKEAGGTWLGVNETGLFVSITNVWTYDGNARFQGEPGTRSRGLLTLDALRCASTGEATSKIRELMRKDTYQFFNLAVVSPTEGTIFTHNGSMKEYSLSPGLTTILNSSYNPEDDPRDGLPPYTPGSDETWLEEVQSYLSQHPDICKHGQAYGTRSSHIVMINKDGKHRFWYADGHPCETEFQDLSDELQGMGSRLYL